MSWNYQGWTQTHTHTHSNTKTTSGTGQCTPGLIYVLFLLFWGVIVNQTGDNIISFFILCVCSIAIIITLQWLLMPCLVLGDLKYFVIVQLIQVTTCYCSKFGYLHVNHLPNSVAIRSHVLTWMTWWLIRFRPSDQNWSTLHLNAYSYIAS